MNNLRELIGRKVKWDSTSGNNEETFIPCEVIDIIIDDSHFEDGYDEPIDILVNLKPLIETDLYPEDFSGIHLSTIYKLD